MSNLPWFRFYAETANDIKFDFLSRELDMPKYALIGIWAILECRASQSPIRGYLYVTEKKRYSNKDVAAELKIETELCNKIIQAFIDMDMLEIENGVIHLKNWEKRQYLSDNSTERVRKYREEHPEKRYSNVSVTPPESDTDTESDTEESTLAAVRKITGLPGSPTDMQAIVELENMKATPADIQAGYDWLKGQGKTVKYYGSLVGPTRTAMAERLNPKGKTSGKNKPDPNEAKLDPGYYRKSEYADTYDN